MKPSGIGGMAVMEGVMMKNKEAYAIAVRKPDNEIVVEKSTYKDFSDKVKLFKLPIFRGMLAFVDSMVIGMKALNYSASFFEDEDDSEARKSKENLAEKADKKADKKIKKADGSNSDFEIEELSAAYSGADRKKTVAAEVKSEQDIAKNDKNATLMMVFAVILSICLSVALFMVLPVLVTNLFSKVVSNKFLNAFIEGVIRLIIFIGYVILAAKMPEIKRVFMYHGAEHKTINCLENGFELTVENVRWQSKQHKRCGTSFMLLVILISLLFFMVVQVDGLFWRVISRILLVPFIAGVSYEFIRLAGKSESKLVNILSQPGLWMQGLTTKEPDDSMIEVAIQSVGAVFDWKAFLKTSADENKEDKTSRPKEAEVKKTDMKKPDSRKAEVKKPDTKKPETKKPDTKRPEAKKSETKAPDTKPDHLKPDAKQFENKKTAIEKSTRPVTGKKVSAQESGDKTAEAAHMEPSKRNKGIPSIDFKPVEAKQTEEEDDEILKALDKFF